MNTKGVPAMVMLTAGLAMCIISIVNGYGFSFLIHKLLFVLIGFYILGCVIKLVLDKTCKREKKEKFTANDLGFEDGEIIEDEEVPADDVLL